MCTLKMCENLLEPWQSLATLRTAAWRRSDSGVVYDPGRVVRRLLLGCHGFAANPAIGTTEGLA
jgi:hypothetical protein